MISAPNCINVILRDKIVRMYFNLFEWDVVLFYLLELSRRCVTRA
jgi:hypothetical protein